LEVVDLFRARAHALGQTLELGGIDEVVVRGDRHLLHEAAAELIENACRHGSKGVPVRIALVRNGSGARLEVENAGAPVQSEVPASDSSPENPRGLGLLILSWIATVHNGVISIARVSDRNQVALVLPLVAEDHASPMAGARPSSTSP
jgi:signal transduction histidine kinase